MVTEVISIEQGAGQPAPRSDPRKGDRSGKPLPKPYFVWDGELRGFGARIDPGRRKNVRSSLSAKKATGVRTQRSSPSGRYGPLTVDEAPQSREGNLGAVATGADPAADLALRRSASTFKKSPIFPQKHVEPTAKTRRRRVMSRC